ncbi:MAG: YebC/PmpR family DNA-binding transcriptional regulator [Acidobacteriota bacterium]
MSGHSKWSTIKHKKAAADSKRGRQFTRSIKEITVAARMGGGDPAGNPRLRSAILAAKGMNMPQDNIKRAIQKGTGELPGVTYQEVIYEGYGPEGVAIYVEALTDNPNRTTPEIRHIFSKHGGNLGAPNCVSWMFEKQGCLTVRRDAVSEERLMEVALEGGAQDVTEEDELFQVTAPVDAFEQLNSALEAADIPVQSAEIAMIPGNTVKVASKKMDQLLRLLEALEDQDDVQKVWGNMEMEEPAISRD